MKYINVLMLMLIISIILSIAGAYHCLSLADLKESKFYDNEAKHSKYLDDVINSEDIEQLRKIAIHHINFAEPLNEGYVELMRAVANLIIVYIFVFIIIIATLIALRKEITSKLNS